MFNKRSISGVVTAATLAAIALVVGAGSASALSGYITNANCSSVTVGWSAETTDPTGYFTLTAVATSGETTQIQRTLVAPGNSMSDETISLPDLSGTGPWEVRLTWDYGDRDMQLLDSVVVSDCDSNPAIEPSVTPVNGTCMVQVSPAGASVSFALRGGNPSSRGVNSSLVSTNDGTSTYILDVLRSAKKAELRSGFKVKALVNGTSFTVKVPSTC